MIEYLSNRAIIFDRVGDFHAEDKFPLFLFSQGEYFHMSIFWRDCQQNVVISHEVDFDFDEWSL